MLRRLAVLLPPLAAVLAFTAPAAPAATIKVTTTQDLASGAGACSLREAVMASNTDAAVGGCPAGSGADVIKLKRGATYTLTIPGYDDVGEAGDLNVTGAVTINARSTTIDGGGIDGIFSVSVGGSLSLSNLTLTGAAAPSYDQFAGGGAIRSSGTVGLRHVLVTHNSAAEEAGGAIFSAGTGTLTITASTISDNQSQLEDPGAGWGGITSYGTLTMRNSVVAGNELGSVAVGGVATISGTLIAGGAARSGPGLVNTGTLHVTGSTVRDGGGVTNRASGELWINNSTVSGNVSGPQLFLGSSWGGDGAGVWNAGTLHLAGTTVSGNTLFETCNTENGTQCSDAGGAGIYNTGSLDIENSTVSGNAIERPCTSGAGTCPLNPGGGILNAGGTLTAAGLTLADNTGATSGGGIAVTGGTVSLTDTIVADNAAGEHADCDGSVALFAYSLLGESAGCTIGTGTGSLLDVDPLLGPLADNGGPTQTQALLAGSPAIDAGPPTRKTGCPRTDQRGVKRPQDGDGNGTARCDIGAFEVAAG